MTTTTVVAHGGALDDWLADRRRRGLDRRDEVWGGVYHVVPHASAAHGALAHRLGRVLADRADRLGLVTVGEFNLGRSDDYRIPDMGWVRADGPLEDLGLYLPTAEVVVEMRSEGDETFTKIPFYLERGVREVWVVDPAARAVSVRTPPPADGAERARSAVFDLAVGEIAAALGWPAAR